MDFEKFDKLTETMDIPPNRRHDLRWLLRNLPINNYKHPNFEEVKQMIKDELLKNARI